MNTASITPAQRKQYLRFIEDTAEKALDALNLNKHGVQCILEKGDVLQSELMDKLRWLSIKTKGNLQLISGGEEIIIAPTTGNETPVDLNTDVSFDYDFKSYEPDMEEKPTEEMAVAVYELFGRDTPLGIFLGFKVPLEKLCFTRRQINAFAKEHQNWLRANRYTHFLFKVGDKFLVASISIGSGDEIYMLVVSCSHCREYQDHIRIVVPCLKPSTI